MLRAYAENRSEEAFSELVRRHIDFVYSAAFRMLRDGQLAEDVTQQVFSTLAQSARQLKEHPVLAGWLHQTARNVAVKLVRSDVRRRAREREAAAMNELHSKKPDPHWEEIAEHLDTVLGDLNQEDRDALLLRYFQRKTAQEVGRALGLSEEAAQKRISRAMERLRRLLARRGVTVEAGGLIALLSTYAVQGAPLGLHALITTSVLAGTAIGSSATVTATKVIVMTTLQKSLVLLTLVGLSTGIFEGSQASRLRDQVQTLQQRQVVLMDQIKQLQQERDEGTNRLATMAEEIVRLKNNSTELLKLRAEVMRLRQAATAQSQTFDPDESTAKEWLKRVNLVKAKFEDWPDKKIPELEFLGDYDWLQIARGRDVENFSETTWRHTMAELRLTAKGHLAHRLGDALQSYIADHAGQLPAQLSDLCSYYEVYVGQPAELKPLILERYRLVQSGSVANLPFTDVVIEEKAAPVDSEYDTHFQFTAYGYCYKSVSEKVTDLGPGSGTFRYMDKIRKYRKD